MRIHSSSSPSTSMAVKLWQNMEVSITALSSTTYITFHYVVLEISGSADHGHHQRFRGNIRHAKGIDGSDSEKMAIKAQSIQNY
uniref:Uncharacterized protein n=1 Tax=Solanum lycopersicum TaxID=4081 RepID=A0A3Q7G3W2_SOLLC